MGIVQIAGISLLGAMLLLLLRELRPSFAPPVRLCISVALLGGGIALLSPIVKQIQSLLDTTGAGEFGEVMLRALGIAMLCELAASFCEDLGEASVAKGVSFFGKLEILVLCLPLVQKVLELAKELLQY